MKSFYHSRYRFYKPDQKEHTIFAISDVHFSDTVSDELEQLALKIEEQKPAIITISGDLIDSLDSADSATELARLKAWMTRIAKVAPVCVCLGNHDFYRKPANFKSGISKNRSYIVERNEKVIKAIDEIENVHYLDDSCFENGDFYVFGLTLPPTYYQFDHVGEKQGGILSPGKEDVNILLEKLDELKEFTAKLPKKKTKIMLVHSPVHILKDNVKSQLSEFDFIFAGHMHNGVVPPFLNEIWRGRRGIITPSKHIFKNHNTRTGLYDNQLIVLGAITTIQNGAGALRHLNRAFPVNYATVETSHKEVYARKPDIRKKYEKWAK